MVLSACAGCALCAENCFLYMGNGQQPEYVPSYKVVKSLGKLYKKKGKLKKEELDKMAELVWKNCVLCGRCNCPFGIELPEMLAYTRKILRSQGMNGIYPYTAGAPEEK